MLSSRNIEKVLERAFDYDEALRRVNRTDREVSELRKLIESVESLSPNLVTNKHLLMFLANDLTVREAFDKIAIFYNLKLGSPEVFRNRNPYSNEIAEAFENQNFLYLPVTPDGYSVIYSSLRNFSVSSFVLDSAAKAMFMTAEASCFNQGPQKGIIFLVDMAGGTLRHLTKINMKTLKLGLKFATEACPSKIIAFHILNAVSFYDIIMKIMKPFAKRELRDLLHLHYADIDWEHFYANHIPRSCLPSDYGGDLESVEVLSRKNLDELKKIQDFFEMEEEGLFRHYRPVK